MTIVKGILSKNGIRNWADSGIGFFIFCLDRKNKNPEGFDPGSRRRKPTEQARR